MTTTSFFDRLTAMPYDELAPAIDIAGGCAYLIAPSALDSNINQLRNGLQQYYSNSRVAYSYKTNYSASFIKCAIEYGLYSEVVSETEYLYARSLNVAETDIIINGPGKSKCFLERMAVQPCTIILDSLSELQIVAKLSREFQISARIGLRIAPKLAFVSTPSRFGIDLSISQNKLKLLRILSTSELQISGIHMHHSGDRSIDSFLERLDFLIDTASELGLAKLQFIDLGGGLGSSVPAALAERLNYKISSLSSYGEALGRHMALRFPDQSVELITEPGTGLLADAGAFLSTVLDVKETIAGWVAIIDGTQFAIDPLRSTVPPEICVVSANGRVNELGPDNVTVRICGNSCMEIDVLHTDWPGLPTKGDIVLVAQKGAYACCMSSPFIQGTPASLKWDISSGFSLLTRRNSEHELLNSEIWLKHGKY